MTQTDTARPNPLGTESVERLLKKYAPPAIISNLMAALYNMADQVFIGHGIGYLGNAATNVAFPLTIICMCVGLMTGVGCATLFNLSLGKGLYDKVRKVCGSSLSTMAICGIALLLIVKLYLYPLLNLFGATPDNMDYAVTYVSIIAYGIPFLLFSTGGNQMVRADGSPVWSMVCTVSGAVLNIFLDPLFMFVFHWGIAGAAWATVISQIVSSALILIYLPKFKTTRLMLKDFIPDIHILKEAWSLGLSPMFNNLATLIVQVVLNNLLRKYGADSRYGSDIPLAAAGIVMKLNTLFTSLIIGLSQGAQPINGFNMGAQKYDRLRKMYRLEIKVCAAAGLFVLVFFQVFATPLILIFGSGNELYMEFATGYLRVFFLGSVLTGMQMISTMFCSQIGHGTKGALLALTRQIFLMIPLLFFMSYTGGIDAIKFATPITDVAAFAITMLAIRQEFRKLPKN